MAVDTLTQLLAKPIHLADQVIKAAAESTSAKHECADLKSKVEKLVNLLRQAARSSSDLYERPTKRIVYDIVHVLSKSLTLVLKCRSKGLKRVFSINQAGAVRRISGLLETCIADVSWLLRVSDPMVDRGDLGLPPIASSVPILGLIWELIAVLHTGSVDDRAEAALSLGTLARGSDRYAELIVEEGGIVPLFKLVKDGKVEEQENAVRAIALLGKNAETVEQLFASGVCMVFTKVLKEGSMKVQGVVAWAIAELVGSYPKCQELFGQSVIRLLVSHLAFETIEEHSKYVIVSKTPSINAVVVASKSNGEEDGTSYVVHPGGGDQIPKHKHKVRESEDPLTKSHMKAMAARALCQLAKDNAHMCRIITESRALLCFAALLQKGSEDTQYNSALALLEITAVAEKDTDLRRSAFRPNATACKAVVDQLVNIIDKGDSPLLIPCIRAIGNLARTFRASETRIISPLVHLLDSSDDNISLESVTALTKFCCTENHLHPDHCKAIIAADGLKHLICLVYFGSQSVQTAALILLCNIALHVPESEEIAKNQVLHIIVQVEKPERPKKPNCIHNETVEKLVQLAKSKLELYQSRGKFSQVSNRW